MLRFISLVGGLSVLLYAMMYTGAGKGWFARPSYSDEIILFLAFTHIFLYNFIARQLGQRPGDFVKIYLGSTVLRILFFGLFIFLVIRWDPSSRTSNALFFLVSYFLFTSLEVAALYLRVNDRKPPNAGRKEG